MDYKNTGYLNRDTKVLACLLEELNKRIRVLTQVQSPISSVFDYAIATNEAPVTIPANVKSFTIVNLGLIADGTYPQAIAISGSKTFSIPATYSPFSMSFDNGTISNSSIIVTPVETHQAAVTWIL